MSWKQNMAKFIARQNVEIPINRTNDLDGSAIASYTYLEGVYIEGVNIEEKAQFIDATNSISNSSILLYVIYSQLYIMNLWEYL